MARATTGSSKRGKKKASKAGATSKPVKTVRKAAAAGKLPKIAAKAAKPSVKKSGKSTPALKATSSKPAKKSTSAKSTSVKSARTDKKPVSASQRSRTAGSEVKTAPTVAKLNVAKKASLKKDKDRRIEAVESAPLKEAKARPAETAPKETAAVPQPTTMSPASPGAKSTAPVAKAEKKSRRADRLIEADKNASPLVRWQNLYERGKGAAAVPYKMSESYEAKTAILHKVLGWGYVLSNQNDRLEVLFQEGIKILISNYKAGR